MLSPLFGVPVQTVNSIETSLVRSSSSEDNHFIVAAVVVDSAVGPDRRSVPEGLNLVPLHRLDIEAPQVVHVGRV